MVDQSIEEMGRPNIHLWWCQTEPWENDYSHKPKAVQPHLSFLSRVLRRVLLVLIFPRSPTSSSNCPKSPFLSFVLQPWMWNCFCLLYVCNWMLMRLWVFFLSLPMSNEWQASTGNNSKRELGCSLLFKRVDYYSNHKKKTKDDCNNLASDCGVKMRRGTSEHFFFRLTFFDVVRAERKKTMVWCRQRMKSEQENTSTLVCLLGRCHFLVVDS